MDENLIKFQLKNLAKEFGFKFNEDWFNVIWIEKDEEILSQFLSDCEDSIYEKYGKTLDERIEYIDNFINSMDYKKCIKRYGGCALAKNDIIDFQKVVNKLKNIKIKEKLLNYIRRTLNELGQNEFAASLTKTDTKEEYNDLMKSILRHEWIHRLLFENDLKFTKLKNEYWIYDEGLCTYFEYYLDNNLEKLEEKKDNEKYPYEKQYYINAIKFRNMLKRNFGIEQKRIIEDFYNSLK